MATLIVLALNMVATLSGKSGKTKKKTKVRKSQEKIGVLEKKSHEKSGNLI